MMASNEIVDAYRFGPVWYVLAFGLACVSVTASLVLNLALALFFAAPGKPASTHRSIERESHRHE